MDSLPGAGRGEKGAWRGADKAGKEGRMQRRTPSQGKGRTGSNRTNFEVSATRRARTPRRPPPREWSRASARTSPTRVLEGVAADQQGRHGRGQSDHARATSPAGRSRSGPWATAPRSARARPRSSPRRTCSSACRRRASSTQKDEVVLSANVHNYLKTDKKVHVSLELEGGTLAALGSADPEVSIPAGGEKRVDWRVKVTGRRRGRRPHEGGHRRRVRRHADALPAATSTACSRRTPSPASSARQGPRPASP